jgi:hypothetical protein
MLGSIIIVERLAASQSFAPAPKDHQWLSKKSKINLCEAIAQIWHRASVKAEPLGHHPQIVAQFIVALFDVASNFAALKWGGQWVRNPPPSHGSPFLQLMYFAA